MSYHRLSLLTEELVRDQMKACPRHMRKSLTRSHIIGSYIKKVGSSLWMFMMYASEHEWYKSRHIIFPESVDVLHKIMGGRYKLEVADCVNLPHDNFCIVFPKGYRIDNGLGGQIEIRQIMCQTLTNMDFMCDFLRYVDLDQLDDDEFRAKAESTYGRGFHATISSVIVGQSKGASFSVAYFGDEFVNVLSKRCDLDMDDNIGLQSVGFDPQKSEIVYYHVFELLVKMFIYIQATGGLIGGFPSGHSYVQPEYNKSIVPKPSILKISPAHLSNNPKSAHYRSFYIRQLRAERYYNCDEWRDKPRGSRFTFVKDTYVNMDVDAETLVEVSNGQLCG